MHTDRRRIPTLWHAHEGAAAAEFALILPLLLILLFGGIEVGRMLADHHTATKAVRDAARYAGRLRATCPSAGSDVGTFDDPAADTRIENLVRTGTIDGSGDPLVGSWGETAPTVDIQIDCLDNSAGTFSGLYDSVGLIPQVTVIVTFDFDTMFGAILSLPTVTMAIDNQQIVAGE
jgi:Flp pilus assembly pilin Flp